MRQIDEWTDKLAELAVFGANVQPGQLVAVTSFIGKEYLTRRIAHEAYRRGAKYVDVLYFDQWIKRERIALAPTTRSTTSRPGCRSGCSTSPTSTPRAFTLGASCPACARRPRSGTRRTRPPPYLPETGEVVNRMTTSWCIVPAPTRSWAEVVYPELEREEAYAALWEAIAHICRLDADDPAEAWTERSATLKANAGRLSERRFDALRLHGAGTDLTIGLLPSAHWAGGYDVTIDGRRHFPNIPTEEVFTTPDPERVDGHVSATKPLELSGSVITGIRVEFEGGRAIKIDADRGAEALRAVASRDEGAGRLGEIALVDKEGRIGPLDTVFLDTLIDENAASHIALGGAYEHPVEDPAERARINRSEIHVDFMIGSPELAVDGITRDGETVPVMRDGAWQI